MPLGIQALDGLSSQGVTDKGPTDGSHGRHIPCGIIDLTVRFGSEIEQRILSTFDYGSPAPNRDGRSQWIGKPQRKFSGVKRDGTKRSLSRNFLFRKNGIEYKEKSGDMAISIGC